MAHTSTRPDPPSRSLFDGPGLARAAARAVDWSATPIGASERWADALRCAIRTCLASPTATAVWAGAGFTLVHNEAYAEILGTRAGSAMGRTAAEVWPEVWSRLEPELTRVLRTGPR